MELDHMGQLGCTDASTCTCSYYCHTIDEAFLKEVHIQHHPCESTPDGPTLPSVWRATERIFSPSSHSNNVGWSCCWRARGFRSVSTWKGFITWWVFFNQHVVCDVDCVVVDWMGLIRDIFSCSGHQVGLHTHTLLTTAVPVTWTADRHVFRSCSWFRRVLSYTLPRAIRTSCNLEHM